jgi:hypothetical protein
MPFDGAITSTFGKLASGMMPAKSRCVLYGVSGYVEGVTVNEEEWTSIV